MTPVVMVAGMFLLTLFVYAVDMALYPWAHSTASQRTLTGTWYGPLRAAHDQRNEIFGMYLKIEHDPWKPHRHSDFDGGVEICTPDSILTGGSIYGSYSRLVPTATPLEISFGISGRVPKDGELVRPLEKPYLGVTGGRLKGKWTGDALTISGTGSLAIVVRDGPVNEALASVKEPLTQPGTTFTATLKRGSEEGFFDLCRQLRAGQKEKD